MLFPKAPSIIDNVRNLKQLLDEPFTYKEYIIICDNRELMRKPNWKELDLLQQEQYKHYLIIRCIEHKPITLHRVITEMINNKHYHKKAHNNDDHTFVEGFATDDKTLFTIKWGS